MEPNLVLYVLAALYITRPAATTNSPVLRQNVGLAFVPMTTPLVNGHQTHPLVIAIPYGLPPLPEMPSPITPTIQSLQIFPRRHLGHHKTEIDALLHMAGEVDAFLRTQHAGIIDAYKNVKYFLTNPINSRVKRAPLGFLGDLARSLFGLATTQDVQNMLGTVTNMDNALKELASQDVKTAEIVHKIATKVDHLFDRFVAEKSKVHESLTHMAISIQNWTSNISMTLDRQYRSNQLEVLQIVATLEGIMQSSKQANFLTNINFVAQSLRLLSTGRLSPDLISAEQLSDAIHDLDSYISKEVQGARVAIKDVQYYFGQNIPMYTYTDTHIYVTVNIIISVTDSLFDLYKVNIMEIPLDTNATNTKGTTFLKTNIDFLAVSKDGQTFLELTNNDMLTCRGDNIKFCPNIIPRFETQDPSCLVALFLEIDFNVHTLCNFKVKPEATPQNNIITISDDEMLITSNQDHYSISCFDKKIINYKASALFIVGLPCNCNLQLGKVILPNSRVPCNKTLSLHYQLHATNLPLIHAMTKETKYVTPSSTSELPLVIPELKMQVLLPKLSDLDKDDDTRVVSLVPYTKILMRNASKLAHHIDAVVDSHSHPPLIMSLTQEPIFGFVGCVLSTINIIIWILVCARGNNAALMLGGLPQLAHQVGAASYRIGDLTKQHLSRVVAIHKNMTQNTHDPKSPSQVTDKTFKILETDQFHNIYSILLMVIIAIIISKVLKTIGKFLYKTCCLKEYTSKSNPSLFVKFYKGNANYALELFPIPAELDIISNPRAPKLIHLGKSFGLIQTLTFEWSGPALMDINGVETAFELPTKLYLPLTSSWSILEKLLKDHNVQSYLLLTSRDNAPVTLKPIQTIDETDKNTNITHVPHVPNHLSPFEALKILFSNGPQPIYEELNTQNVP